VRNDTNQVSSRKNRDQPQRWIGTALQEIDPKYKKRTWAPPSQRTQRGYEELKYKRKQH
jgi:hypothetical protein